MDSLTDAYLDELIVRLNAEADHAEKLEKRRARDARHGRRRRTEGPGWVNQDVSLDDIESAPE